MSDTAIVTEENTNKVFVIWFRGKRVLRTFVQTVIPSFIGFAAVLPQILEASNIPVTSELYLWLLGVAGGVTATATGLSGIMAIPAVNKFLTNFLALGSVPKKKVEEVAVLDTTPTEGQKTATLAEVAQLPRDEQINLFQEALSAQGLDPEVGNDGTGPNSGR